MSKPYPVEFRRDVVAVARKHQAPLAQIAKDFGVSEATLHNWLRKADVEDGIASGATGAEASEIRTLRNACACWSRKTKSCVEPRRTCLRRTCQKIDVSTLAGGTPTAGP
ncbi:transposase-like protein [Arthrobacter sp. CAN_A214]